jgi:hypothetical protein
VRRLHLECHGRLGIKVDEYIRPPPRPLTATAPSCPLAFATFSAVLFGAWGTSSSSLFFPYFFGIFVFLQFFVPHMDISAQSLMRKSPIIVL